MDPLNQSAGASVSKDQQKKPPTNAVREMAFHTQLFDAGLGFIFPLIFPDVQSDWQQNHGGILLSTEPEPASFPSTPPAWTGVCGCEKSGACLRLQCGGEKKSQRLSCFNSF